jgi:hypothetical protein
MPLKNPKPDLLPDLLRDLDLDERRSRIELNRAQRIVALWACPILADSEVPEVLRIPPSTWQLRKKSQDGPPIFSIGKRSYVRTAQLLEWCGRLRFVPKNTHLVRAG